MLQQNAIGDDQVDNVGRKEKQFEDSQVDSGFLSSGNILSSQLSIEFESRDLSEDELKDTPELAKASESELNLISDVNINKTLLQDETLLDSGIIDANSEEFINEETDSIKNETNKTKLLRNESLNTWKFYYSQNNLGDTKLHHAIIQENTKEANRIIDIAPYSSLLDIQNDDWQTPLYLAVLMKQPNVIRKLVLSGADLTKSNFNGDTPLHLACSTGNLETVKALTSPLTEYEKSALGDKRPKMFPQDLQLVNHTGQTCIHLATKISAVEVIRELVTRGADVNASEGLSGYTPLHIAIIYGLKDVAMFLVRECQAELDRKSYDRRTAYIWARQCDPQLATDLAMLSTDPSRFLDLASDNESDDYTDDDDDSDIEYEENENLESQKKYFTLIEKLNTSSSLVV